MQRGAVRCGRRARNACSRQRPRALGVGPGETTVTEEKEGGGGSGEFGAAAALQQLHLVSGTTPMPMFPKHRIVLVSPAMPRFESKAKLKFCLGKSYFRETSWGEGVVEEVIKATLAEASARCEA